MELFRRGQDGETCMYAHKHPADLIMEKAKEMQVNDLYLSWLFKGFARSHPIIFTFTNGNLSRNNSTKDR